jgi:hypothetical protein
MATATKSVKASSVKASDVASDLPTDAVDVSIVPPTDAPSLVPPTDAPSLQEALSGAGSTDAPLVPDSTAVGAALSFVDHQNRLKACIIRQQSGVVAMYAERGEICLDAIDVKTAYATDKNTRAKAYSTSVTALLADAIGVSCDLSEPAPNIARWIMLAGLVRKFPRAKSLPSVRGAVEIAIVVGQTSKPTSYHAPITFVVHPRYPVAQIEALIERAITENLTTDQIAKEVQIIGGKIAPKPVSDEASDPIALGKATAKLVMDRINDDETPIDPFVFFAEFLTLASEYGYSVAPSRDGIGAGRFKLVK